jgi:hypothetical protein
MFKFLKAKKNSSESPQGLEQEVVPALSGKALELKRRNSRKNGFMSVIPESSVEEVFNKDFKTNEAFIAEYNGRTCYFGFIVKAEDARVINKKSINDENVGIFIKQIQESSIVVCENQQLLDEEKIFICPTQLGMTIIDEILYLKQVPFYITYITDVYDIVDTGIETNFEEVFAILNGDADISVFVNKLNGAANNEAASEDEVDDSAEDNAEETDEAHDDNGAEDLAEELDFSNGDDVDEDASDTSDESDNSSDFLEDAADLYSEEPVNEFYDGDDYEDDEEEVASDETVIADTDTEPVFSADDFKNAVSFEFFTGDLDLKVSTDHFDSLFLHWNEYNRFPTDREDGWINKRLNELSKEANHELAELHNNNLLKLREKYKYHVNNAAQEVAKAFDLNNTEGDIGKKKAELDRWLKEQEKELPEAIVERRREINKEYEEDCEKYVKASADSARRSYQERNAPAHKDRIESVDTEVRNNLRIEFEEKLRDLNEERRIRAKREFDDYLTDVQKGISKDYALIVDDETKVYKSWRDKMARYVDENRKDEAINNKVRLEELTQTTIADKVREEMQHKLDVDHKLFESKLEAHKKDLEMLKSTYEEKLDINRAEVENERVRFDKDRESLRVDLENMTNRYQSAKDEIGKEFEARLKQAEDDKIAWSNKYDTLVAMHKKNNGLYIALAGVAIIASLAFGTIIGSYINISVKNDAAVTESINKFDEKLKESDANSKKLLDSINKANGISNDKQSDVKSDEGKTPVTNTEVKSESDTTVKPVEKKVKEKPAKKKKAKKKKISKNTEPELPEFNKVLEENQADSETLSNFYKNN